MELRTKSGRNLSAADIDRLIESAERGLNAAPKLRRGRPFLDAGATEHAPRLTVRVPVGLRDRVTARAAAEGRTISEVLRSLLEDYASGG